MFSAKSLVALLTLALSVAATPVASRDGHVTLSFAKHVNATGTLNLLAQDQARARFLKNRGSRHLEGRDGSIPVTNEAVSYLAAVGVGSPATTCERPPCSEYV